MATIHPSLSDKAGRIISVHNRGGICATSSKITPSIYNPRRESGLSHPRSCILAPLGKSALSSVS